MKPRPRFWAMTLLPYAAMSWGITGGALTVLCLVAVRPLWVAAVIFVIGGAGFLLIMGIQAALRASLRNDDKSGIVWCPDCPWQDEVDDHGQAWDHYLAHVNNKHPWQKGPRDLQ